MLGDAAFSERRAEHLQRLVLRRGREGEVAGVGEDLPRFHDPVDRVFDRLVLFLPLAAGA